MPFRLPSPPRERRLPLLVAVLTLGFLLTAAVAWQAWSSAHRHRATAERTLRDYAEFGALQFAVHAKEGIYTHATAVLFRPVDPATGHRAGRAVAPGFVDKGTNCFRRLESGPASRFLFSIDLRTPVAPHMLVARGCATPGMRRWLRDTVAAHALAKFDRRWERADFIATGDGIRWLVVYSVRYDDWDQPAAAFGFAAPFRDFARPSLAEVMKYYTLLPPALVGKVPNDSLLSVVVTDATGEELYRSAVQYESKFRAEHLMHKVGGIKVSLTLNPAAADRLVIGGLPQSRLPLLFGLLALAATLTVVALRLLKRETELARLRADFVSSISHELRTPLAQVRMFAETLLLDRVRGDGERRRSLEIIDQEARRLTHLVENVLQFSRNERRVTRLSPEPTDLGPELCAAAEGFAPLAAARGMRVECAAEPGVVAEVDRAALRQTLLNLLDNAVKYGPRGQLVRVGLERTPAMARITVDDEGPGIPPRERERVWAPFQRLERDANSSIAGSGIGLSVVRDLVAMHGGRTAIEQAPGGGARFVVELPRVVTPAEGDAARGGPAQEMNRPAPAHA